MNKGLEALEKVTGDYKDLVIKHYYASDIDKNERQELFYKLDKDFEIIKKELEEGEETKRIAKSYKELVFTLIEELNIEFELSIEGGRDEDGQIDIDYFISLNGDRKKVGLTKAQYELFREWEEN